MIYTEKQVNAVLARFHEDISGLRRDLIDRGMLARRTRRVAFLAPDGIQPVVNGSSNVDEGGDQK